MGERKSYPRTQQQQQRGSYFSFGVIERCDTSHRVFIKIKIIVVVVGVAMHDPLLWKLTRLLRAKIFDSQNPLFFHSLFLNSTTKSV